MSVSLRYEFILYSIALVPVTEDAEILYTMASKGYQSCILCSVKQSMYIHTFQFLKVNAYLFRDVEIETDLTCYFATWFVTYSHSYVNIMTTAESIPLSYVHSKGVAESKQRAYPGQPGGSPVTHFVAVAHQYYACILTDWILLQGETFEQSIDY